MSDGDLLNIMGTDGAVWAREWNRMFPGPVRPSEEVMLGWFANAIEAGRSAGVEQGQRDALAGAVARVKALPGLFDSEKAYVTDAIKGGSDGS